MGLNMSKHSYLEDSSLSEDDHGNDEISNLENPQEDDINDNISLNSETNTLDANVSTAPKPIVLNLDQVVDIENDLDLYEKISLGYLLYDDPELALQKLSKLLDEGSEKIIYNWSISQSLAGKKWAEKLIEALCIIQNYQVLGNLGFKRQDLNVIFLPQHDFTCVYINKFHKVLYFVCEEFVQNNVQQLLKLVHQDFLKKNFVFKYLNAQYLELYFLYWEYIGYIKQNNLSSLCSVLKQMDQLDLCNRLKQLVPVHEPSSSRCDTRPIERSFSKTVDNAVSSKQPKNVFDIILDPTLGLTELSSFESPISADNAVYVSAENKYYIDPCRPGICLIINQQNFYREIDKKSQHLLPPSDNKLESRSGSLCDKEKLEETFEKFGFQTVTEDDLTHLEMLKKIEEIIKSVTSESSLFVCIMSHGDEGVVYGVNSCRVHVNTIKHLMCNKNRHNLSGKPKVLILQSCQGTQCQLVPDSDDDVTMDGHSPPKREAVPPRADLYTFWATVPGYGAIRNKRTGSWFIQSLCEKMTELGSTHHFDDICTSVTLEVTNKRWAQPHGQVAMVPMRDSTFRKLLYLPSKRE